VKLISKIALVFCAGLGFVGEGVAGREGLLTFTSFNLKWFGLGGSMSNSLDDEHRDQSLREFISTKIPPTDVFSFQEVVDVPRLKDRIVPNGFECVSYDREDAKHQHVVLCVAPHLTIDSEPTDDNDIIDEVADAVSGPNKARPAVHIRIKNSEGKILSRVVGVHLKAYPQESLIRQKQATVIAKYLKKLQSSKFPIVVLGDFNTYSAADTGEKFDDTDLLGRIFNGQGLKLARAPVQDKFTFRSPRSRGLFDHIWASNSWTVASTPQIYKICNEAAVNPFQRLQPFEFNFDDADEYYSNVSDHCPLTVKYQISQ